MSAPATDRAQGILSVLVDQRTGYRRPDVDRIDGTQYDRVVGLKLESGRPIGQIDAPVPPSGLEWADVIAADSSHHIPLRSFRTPKGPVHAQPVSVVVPTIFQRIDGLERCVQSLLASTDVEVDIVVVDNRRSANEAFELPRDRFPDVRVIREPKPGISAARNAGVRFARGDIVAFTDDDVEVTPWWLASLSHALSDSVTRVAAVGLVHPARLDSKAAELFESSGARAERSLQPYVYQGAALRSLPGGRRSDVVRLPENALPISHSLLQAGGFGMGCNMAFRRSALLRRPFDENLGTGTRCRGGEDIARLMEVLLYEGELVFEPSAILLHDHRDTVDALRRQMYAYGCGFSAALTSLVVSDRRLFWSFAVSALPALRRFFQPTSDRNSARTPSPEWKTLARQELWGLATGPFEYAAAHFASRRSRDQAG